MDNIAFDSPPISTKDSFCALLSLCFSGLDLTAGYDSIKKIDYVFHANVDDNNDDDDDNNNNNNKFNDNNNEYNSTNSELSCLRLQHESIIKSYLPTYIQQQQ